MRKIHLLLCGLLLAGALWNGVSVIDAHLRRRDEFRTIPRPEWEYAVLGPYAPVVRKVRASIPPGEGIVLDSDANLAPLFLSYALFPRKIWQTRTETAISQAVMELPPSPYPTRLPDSFPVSWMLVITEANLEKGGELLPIEGAAGRR